MENTFSGWMPTICWLPTRSPGRWRLWIRETAGEFCSLRHGDSFCIDRIEHGLPQPDYGRICRRSNGCYAKWDKMSSCKPPTGSSAVSYRKLPRSEEHTSELQSRVD